MSAASLQLSKLASLPQANYQKGAEILINPTRRSPYLKTCQQTASSISIFPTKTKNSDLICPNCSSPIFLISSQLNPSDSSVTSSCESYPNNLPLPSLSQNFSEAEKDNKFTQEASTQTLENLQLQRKFSINSPIPEEKLGRSSGSFVRSSKSKRNSVCVTDFSLNAFKAAIGSRELLVEPEKSVKTDKPGQSSGESNPFDIQSRLFQSKLSKLNVFHRSQPKIKKPKIFTIEHFEGISIIPEINCYYYAEQEMELEIFHDINWIQILDEVTYPGVNIDKCTKKKHLKISSNSKMSFNPKQKLLSLCQQENTFKGIFHNKLNIQCEVLDIEIFPKQNQSASNMKFRNRRDSRESIRSSATMSSHIFNRDPMKDFFILLCQCIKLNAQNRDELGRFPVDSLYQKAIQEHIPFSKWYDYIKERTILNKNHKN
ncbi:hypothetical protein SteCoe_3436 [Stentor coeruleus]|uniref:Uncharacterized protein n=1 Tax=Stentor coeruleus TaxID=5963 RepID=A0A1R2CX59_9CILI|nr:hypothetical protein SteCoe_3436 [Stentor coeruleus]